MTDYEQHRQRLIEKAVQAVIDAYVVEGKCPSYHRQQKQLLKQNWRPLDDAINQLIREVSK